MVSEIPPVWSNHLQMRQCKPLSPPTAPHFNIDWEEPQGIIASSEVVWWKAELVLRSFALSITGSVSYSANVCILEPIHVCTLHQTWTLFYLLNAFLFPASKMISEFRDSTQSKQLRASGLARGTKSVNQVVTGLWTSELLITSPVPYHTLQILFANWRFIDNLLYIWKNKIPNHIMFINVFPRAAVTWWLRNCACDLKVARRFRVSTGHEWSALKQVT